MGKFCAGEEIGKKKGTFRQGGKTRNSFDPTQDPTLLGKKPQEKVSGGGGAKKPIRNLGAPGQLSSPHEGFNAGLPSEL